MVPPHQDQKKDEGIHSDPHHTLTHQVKLKGRGHFESLLYNFNILMGKSMKNHVVEKFERKKSFKIRYFKNNDKNCVWLKPNYYSNPIFQIHF